MKRLRSFRKDEATRDKYAEIKLSKDDLIQPYFIVDGSNVREEIPGLSGIYHFSTDTAIDDISRLAASGINAIIIFGAVDASLKDGTGSNACAEGNLVARAVGEIKNRFPGLTVMTDVCLCGYTNHGHCGLVKDGEILNDETLPLLAQMALTHAKSGADFVAPSAMMDGQVGAIRDILNKNGLKKTRILSYSTKYASNFYGPFRNAAGSAPSFGDRKTYQCDYRTVKQGIEEARQDIREGADWLMVKPAHTYLDMICRIKKKFPRKTLAAYHVSGEYMAVRKLAEASLADEKSAMLEVLTGIKRAGADKIITYFAKDFALMKS